MANDVVTERRLSIGEIAIIVLFACVPLFFTFPYRVNIFLSWEGAYRMNHDQLPFRDFGIPMGGMYWVIPAIFFKLFGAKMITLVKAQVFINIISGLAFRSILKSCEVQPGIRFLSVIIYCISFSFFNFWPWYNHTVIVYEFIGLAFLLKSIHTENSRYGIVWLLLASLFTCFSFMTKQDGGGMAMLISLILLIYDCWSKKKWAPLFLFIGAFAVFLFLMIAPFLQYDFRYWFNHGQPPHTTRISIQEIVDEFFGASVWIKFYLFFILVILFIRFGDWKEFRRQQQQVLFLLLTVCILGEAAVFQVTSYTPPDNNIFFHSFAIAFILSALADRVVNFNKTKIILISFVGIMVWWSGVYWNYIQRIIQRTFPSIVTSVSPTEENIVNSKTFMINLDTTEVPMAQWKFTGLRSFDKIYMPPSTVDGIHRLLDMDIVKNKKDLHVLNMTELTPLSVEIPCHIDAGPDIPLWYHLGVGMFNREAKMFEKRIAGKQYDLVLFEYIPSLNNFFPFRVRDSLQVHYQKIDSFSAPRRGDTPGMIEVYIPSQNSK